jgi:hypothetical protein
VTQSSLWNHPHSKTRSRSIAILLSTVGMHLLSMAREDSGQRTLLSRGFRIEAGRAFLWDPNYLRPCHKECKIKHKQSRTRRQG